MMIFAGGHGLLDRQARLDARALGHADVEQHHVGRRALGERGALDAVAGLADDLDAGLDGEQHRQAAAEQLLVVDHEHADGLAARSGRMIRDLTRTASWHERARAFWSGRISAARGPARSRRSRSPAAVDDRGSLALLVDEQVEVVADQLHLVERLVERHRAGRVGLLAHHERAVAGDRDRADLALGGGRRRPRASGPIRRPASRRAPVRPTPGRAGRGAPGAGRRPGASARPSCPGRGRGPPSCRSAAASARITGPLEKAVSSR